MEELAFKPIGHYKANKKDESSGSIELASWVGDETGESFLGLEKDRRVWVLFVPKIKDDGERQGLLRTKSNGKDVGVFASRSRQRPNPVGMGLARVKSVEGTTLHLSYVPTNIVGGSPVLDISPFSVGTDKLKKTLPNPKSHSSRKTKTHYNNENTALSPRSRKRTPVGSSGNGSSNSPKLRSREKRAHHRVKNHKHHDTTTEEDDEEDESEDLFSERKLSEDEEEDEDMPDIDLKSGEHESDDKKSNDEDDNNDNDHHDSDSKKKNNGGNADGEKSRDSKEDNKKDNSNNSSSSTDSKNGEKGESSNDSSEKNEEDHEEAKEEGTPSEEGEEEKEEAEGEEPAEVNKPTLNKRDSTIVSAVDAVVQSLEDSGSKENEESKEKEGSKDTNGVERSRTGSAGSDKPETRERSRSGAWTGGKLGTLKRALGFGAGKEKPKGERKPEQKTAPKIVYAKCYDDLPPECKKLAKGAKIEAEQMEKHFEILLNILHFKTKLSFRQKSYHEGDEEVSTKKRKSSSPKRILTEEDVGISTDDPKKVYKTNGFAGKGGFGRVYKGNLRKNSDELVAIKKMPHVSNKEIKRNFEEVRYLRDLTHPCIVSYKNSWIVKDELWLVTEFMEGGTLSEAVKGFDFEDRQIAYIALQMLKALDYLHDKKLVHRDLKSANVMMTIGGEIKLIDFGLCIDMNDDTEKNHMAGSPFWMAPEMIQKKSYSMPLDVWSFAICLMELANGHPPNKNNSIKALFVAATEGYPSPLEAPQKWHRSFSEFLARCLVIDPDNRATVKELLNDPFLRLAASKESMKKVLTYVFMQTAINLATFG